ncbi:MAG TPA: hypothetical protein VIU37_07500 [Candidatus Limnocylindrales bacterium]
MKRAAAALRLLVLDGIGLEGGFLLLGTIALAVGAGFIAPAGPWLVVGGMSVLVGILLAPRRGG